MKNENDFLKMITTPGQHRVVITPDQAQALLDLNTLNRGWKKTSLDRFHRILKAGHWRLTNDAITIDTNGDVANGQHRLRACVETNIPLALRDGSPAVLLLTGAPPDIRDVIDTGVKRSFGDSLQIKGRHNATQLAAGATLHRKYTRGVAAGKTYTGVPNEPLDHLEMLEYLDRYPIIEQVIPTATSCRQALGGQPAAWTAFCAMIFTVDPDDATTFTATLKSGANLPERDPRLALRNYLLHLEPGQRAEKVLGIMIKSWNAWRTGRRMKVAGMRADEVLQRAA